MSSKPVNQLEGKRKTVTSEQVREYMRKRRQRRIKAGLCASCNQPRGEDGTKSRCRNCADKSNADAARKVAQMKEAGLCVQCGKSRGDDGTRTLCRSCAEKLSERARRRVERRRAAELCLECGEPLGKDRTGVLCRSCADKTNRRLKRRIEEGRCRQCGKPRDKNGTGTSCSRCLKKAREGESLRHAHLKEAGHCPSCGKPRDDKTKVYCSHCRERHWEQTKRRRGRRIREGRCPDHPKSPLLVLKLCPACHYETTDDPASSISFEGLLPPPDSDDKNAKLDTCVRCEHCDRLYHKGETSYHLPQLPPNMKLRDEHIGEEGCGVWLRFSQEDEQGQVEIEFEVCSLPDEKCKKLVPREKALIYLWRYRVGKPMSMACKDHFNDRLHLKKAYEARFRQQFDTSAPGGANGNGQETGSADKRRGRPTGRTTVDPRQTISDIQGMLRRLKSKGRSCSSVKANEVASILHIGGLTGGDTMMRRVNKRIKLKWPELRDFLWDGGDIDRLEFNSN